MEPKPKKRKWSRRFLDLVGPRKILFTQRSHRFSRLEIESWWRP
jgi:hypothetical protein